MAALLASFLLAIASADEPADYEGPGTAQQCQELTEPLPTTDTEFCDGTEGDCVALAKEWCSARASCFGFHFQDDWSSEHKAVKICESAELIPGGWGKLWMKTPTPGYEASLDPTQFTEMPGRCQDWAGVGVNHEHLPTPLAGEGPTGAECQEACLQIQSCQGVVYYSRPPATHSFCNMMPASTSRTGSRHQPMRADGHPHATCYIRHGCRSESFHSYRRSCRSADGTDLSSDLAETVLDVGASEEACKAFCAGRDDCQAVEWYPSEYPRGQCRTVQSPDGNASTPRAVQGGGMREDAICNMKHCFSPADIAGAKDIGLFGLLALMLAWGLGFEDVWGLEPPLPLLPPEVGR